MIRALAIACVVSGCAGGGTIGGGTIGGGTAGSGALGEDRASYWDDPASGPEQLPPGEDGDPEDALLGAAGLLRIDLQVTDASYAALRDAPREYARGHFGFRGDWVPNVGLRLKGFIGSFRPIDAKPGWKVSFDRFVPGRRYADLEGITLNNLAQDPSALHEWLGYQFLAAAGLPVPRVSFAEVRLLDEPYGLYALIESPNDDFLRRQFDDADGNLYDVSWFDDVVPGGQWGYQHDEGAGDDRSDLGALIDAVWADLGPGWIEGLAPVLDVERFVTMMAADVLLGHWDGYGGNVNNYRIYCETSGRCTFLPWGIDQTFGSMLDPMYQAGALGQRCIADTACRNRYVSALQRLVDLWRSMPLRAWAEAQAAYIEPAVERDPRREWGFGDHQAAVEGMLSVIDSRADEAQAFIDGQ